MPNVFDMIISAMCLGGLGLLTNSFGATDPIGVGYTFLGALFIAIYLYVLDRYVTPATAFMLTFLQMVGIMTSFGGVYCYCSMTLLGRHYFSWFRMF